jgi:ubiquinol-cytochrome c reductase cytochrome c subunit
MKCRVVQPVVGLAIFATCAVLGVATVQASAGAGRAAGGDGDGGAVRRGRQLYLLGCASCHGADARGTRQGPDLHGVGAASADFQLTTGRMPNTEPDRQAVRKPPAYSRKQIDDLVAYVASLGDGPPIPDVHSPPGSLVGGGELYRLNCAACHSSGGNGGALSSGRDAPDLHHASPTEVAEAIRTGPGQMPVFGPATLTDRQVNSIVRYVEYLKDPDNPGGFSLGLVGPITEGLVAILVGLGALALACRWIEPKVLRPR